MIRLSDAIYAINSNAKFIIRANDIDRITWTDGTTPIAKADIEAKMTELQTNYDNQEYARNRAAAYPSLQEFAEAYCEKEIGAETTKWDEYVVKYNKVRTDNPK
tara:strand:+ start:333 stop:644 length:312 start_codon:yes stop_codon:yes gene_type:complete